MATLNKGLIPKGTSKSARSHTSIPNSILFVNPAYTFQFGDSVGVRALLIYIV